jgi:hypothetical protein
VGQRTAQQLRKPVLLTISVVVGCVAVGVVVPYLFFWAAANHIDFGPDGYFLILMAWMISIPLGLILGIHFSKSFWRP